MLHKIVYIIKTHIFANQNIMVVFYVMFDISSIHAKSRTNPHNNNKHLTVIFVELRVFSSSIVGYPKNTEN